MLMHGNTQVCRVCLVGKINVNVQRWFELNVPAGVGWLRVIYGINVARISLLALIELEFAELTLTDIFLLQTYY